MRALKKIFSYSGYLTLAAMLSCEIHDDWSKPDLSEELGTRIYRNVNYSYGTLLGGLLWSEKTNEIIIVNFNNIIAVDPTTQGVRTLLMNDPNRSLDAAWLFGNTLFLLGGGIVSTADITTMRHTATLADSASVPFLSSPFSTTHFAYVETRTIDTWPFTTTSTVVIHDLQSHEETVLGEGQPHVFSPDGQQLLYSNNTEFFIYDLETKAITKQGFNEYYGVNILRWTTDGILSFHQDGEFIVGRNESIDVEIGKWRTAEGLYTQNYDHVVSPSSRHLITVKTVCAYEHSTGNCPGSMKAIYSMVDVYNDSEVPLASTVNNGIILRAFSPDEKSFAFATINNDIYISKTY